jgi:hypothetical protein
VPASAPRIPQRLLEAIVHLDDGRAPIAEIIRLVGTEADRLAITRPSYERIRQLIHESRRLRRRRGPTIAQVFSEAAIGTRSLDSAKLALATRREERR